MSSITLSPLDTDPANVLRSTFALFPTGVAAIAGDTPEGPAVLVASSFQVGISLDPPLVLFAVQHSSSSWPRLRQLEKLGVSVLAQDHSVAVRQLASRSGDRFANVETYTHDGAVFIKKSPVWMECSIFSEVSAGDHDVILLQVHSVGMEPAVEPLIWHSSSFRGLSPS